MGQDETDAQLRTLKNMFSPMISIRVTDQGHNLLLSGPADSCVVDLDVIDDRLYIVVNDNWVFEDQIAHAKYFVKTAASWFRPAWLGQYVEVEVGGSRWRTTALGRYNSGHIEVLQTEHLVRSRQVRGVVRTWFPYPPSLARE